MATAVLARVDPCSRATISEKMIDYLGGLCYIALYLYMHACTYRPYSICMYLFCLCRCAPSTFMKNNEAHSMRVGFLYMAANASCNRVGWLFAHHTTEVGVAYNSAGFTLLAEQMILSDNRVGFAAIPLGAETMDYGSVNVTQTAVIGYSDNPGAFQIAFSPLLIKVNILRGTLIQYILSLHSIQYLE